MTTARRFPSSWLPMRSMTIRPDDRRRSGNGRTGNIVNATRSTTGKYGGALTVQRDECEGVDSGRRALAPDDRQ